MESGPLNIYLVQEGDSSSYRLKNDPGSNYRSFLIDDGDALITQANIKYIAHGKVAPDGDPATLLVLEFQFINRKKKADRRFKSATITLKFEDENENESFEPEVLRIAPDGDLYLNQTTRTRELSHKWSGGITLGVDIASAQLGYEMELQETKTSKHATSITGIKRVCDRAYGRPNTAIWTLRENSHMADGIPSFLRTSILLKRKPDAVFRGIITVETQVDFRTYFQRLVGRERTDPVDPFDIDPNVEHPEDLKTTQVDLDRLGELDFMEIDGVLILKE